MARKNDIQAAPRNNNSPVMLIILVLVLVLIGLNTYLLWDTRNLAAASAVGAVQAEPEPTDPVFVAISPFTVNLQSDQFGPRLLYAGLTLEVPSEKVKATLMKNMPQVRNRLLVLLSGQEAEKIAQSEGKKILAKSIMDSLSAPYQGDEELAINEVLFTEFIVQ
ncbi:flagellar basal body-associated protein FliL [Pseudidiomarina andamanensis]|uniref:Flagellar protein FliL n=1 Tax=Pseudidiomarina andamanensis TaxID=1940690 RepID=A0AA92ETM9_9GAMM|nr:flagellar basal body-associated protein FliL [Pseudidiomarina andamanensis]MDS0218898.1 flagellar basal body-associated protein FliL [Pseudidiomarina andamanensis]QGT96263.1 flagellar basal body-associated protein FliL [Pseudidiomarina andamanensis]